MKTDPVLRFQNLLLTGLLTTGAAASTAIGQAGFTLEKLQSAWSQGTLGACLVGGALSGVIGYLYNRLASSHDEEKAQAKVTHEDTGPNGHLTRLSAQTVRCLLDRLQATTPAADPRKATFSYAAFHADTVWLELMQGDDETIRRTVAGQRFVDVITARATEQDFGHLLSPEEWAAFICFLLDRRGAPEILPGLPGEIGGYLHEHFAHEFYEQAKHAAGRDPVTYAALQLHLLGAIRSESRQQSGELRELRQQLATSSHNAVAAFGPAESKDLGNYLAELGADIALLRADLDELPKRVADTVLSAFDARLQRIERASAQAAWWARKGVQLAGGILVILGILAAHQWWRGREQEEQGNKIDRIVQGQELQVPVLAGIRDTTVQVAAKTQEVAEKTQRVEEKTAQVMENTQRVVDELVKLKEQVAGLNGQIALAQTASEKPRAVVEAVTRQLLSPDQSDRPKSLAAAEEDAARSLNLTIAQLREQIPLAKDNAAERLRLADALAELGKPREGAGEEESKLRTMTAETARKERLQAIRDLADAERLARRYDQAAAYLRQAEALTDRTRDEAEWAEVRKDLAALKFAQGRYPESGEILLEVLPIFQRSLGNESPRVLVIQNNLAMNFLLQGDCERAEKQGSDLLPVQRRVLGENHRETLNSRLNLLMTQVLAGKHDKVSEHLPLLLSDLTRELGPKDPLTLSCRGLQILNTTEDGGYIQLKNRLGALIADLTEVLGPEAPVTLMRRRELIGLRCKELEDKAKDPPDPATIAAWSKLETEMRDLLKTQERLFGRDDPDALQTRRDLAWFAANLRRYDESRKLMEEVITSRARIFGENAPPTLEARWDSGMLQKQEGQDEAAAATFLSVIAAWEQSYGPGHRKTLGSRVLFAEFLNSRSRYEEAEVQLRALISAFEAKEGAKSPIVHGFRAELGRALFNQGKFGESEKELRGYLPVLIEVYGPDHAIVLELRQNLALMADKQEQFAESEKQYRQLATDLVRINGPSHEATLTAQANVAGCLFRRDPQAAISLAEATLKAALKSPKKNAALIESLRLRISLWKKVSRIPLPMQR